jgi:hypothetical protein
MNTIDEVVTPLLEKLAGRVEDKWYKSKYEVVKAAANTPKGDFGEEVTAALIKELIGMNAEIINGGKGEFDILTDSGIKFEHKLATEDTSGGHQFNGLKKSESVDYDYAFCLGVSPNDLWFNIWSKKEVKELTTSMTKDGSESFKLSARKTSGAKYPLLPLTPENFKREVSKIV